MFLLQFYIKFILIYCFDHSVPSLKYHSGFIIDAILSNYSLTFFFYRENVKTLPR